MDVFRYLHGLRLVRARAVQHHEYVVLRVPVANLPEKDVHVLRVHHFRLHPVHGPVEGADGAMHVFVFTLHGRPDKRALAVRAPCRPEDGKPSEARLVLEHDPQRAPR